MDYIPIARRTRSREALMYRKLHEELKRKNHDKKLNASESTSFSGFSDVKGESFSGSCQKDNVSESLEPDDNYGVLKRKKSSGLRHKDNGSENLGRGDYGVSKGRSSSGSCQKDNGSENLGLGDYGVAKGKSSSGSCQRDNESDNLGHGDDVLEKSDLGPYDSVDKFDMGASNYEILGFECVDNDDSEERDWRESGRVEVEESSSRSISNGEKGTDVVTISDSDSTSSSGESVEDSDDEVEIETSSSGDDDDCVEETPDDSSDFEVVSSESEEEDQSHQEEEHQVSARETGSRGKGDKVELRLKRKKWSDSSNGKDDAVDGGQKRDCVSKRIRSQNNLESSKKRIGLGTINHPICLDKGDLEDFDHGGDYCNGVVDGETFEIEEIDDEEHVQDFCGGQPTRKRIRAYEDHEVVKILANSILDKTEMPCEEIDEPVIEPSLPLKFTFGTEEQVLVEKSEEEKELEKLWAEMSLALCADDATDDAVAENTADVTLEDELDTDALCQQGKHQYILDEEIGIKCKFCSFVNVEIKYCTAPFGRHTSGYSERRDYYAVHLNVFDELHDQDCGRDSQPGCDPFPAHARGTVWNIIPGIGKDLHEHQREGFEFLWKNIAGGIYLDKLKEPTSFDSGSGGCIISHAPGTGKTRLAIVFLQTHMKLYPTCRPVIIAPSSMLLSWEAEFKKWKVDIPFHNLNTPKVSGEENVAALKLFKYRQHSINSVRMLKLYSWKNDRSILGISYKLFEELVGQDKKRSTMQQTNVDGMVRKILLELPGLLVLDEGHTPRNDQSLIWKALSKVRTEKRIILSGTPFQNNFDELYNTLCLARPKFADRMSSKFNVFFERKHGRKVNGARRNWTSLTSPLGRVTDDRLKAERLEEVRAMIRPFVHVHKGNILQQRLPGLRDAMIILQPPYLQKSLLDKIEQKENLRTSFDLEYLVSLVSVHPSLLLKHSFNLEEFGGRGMLEKLRLNPDVGVKTKFLIELIRLSGAISEKVLVFSQYLHPLTFICKLLESRFNWIEGKEILRMTGKVDTVQRQSLIMDFNSRNSQAKVMLASTKACSEGINLVGASRVVLLDVVWNPAVERQAISRAYRLGQEKVVHIYRLVISGTMEEEKYCRQAEKERLSELVFYSSERAHNREKISYDVSEDAKDAILEEMINRNKLKDMFKRIIYQPKDSNLVDSFGLVNL
ncbi:SNF2 domain-containing protein CLASSY 4 isoform X2 [Hevea brasiliensis]|uniref:SNF2 domain-containing protein CLASSY 4 isoform X2 n=1 Tax=Hevea brasiliensis TaxID=3981 RepID=UPI0025CC71DB|nr:SNF2 domain-containing protein CLASSY 4 isoform X2 [Hevea brasiliensis]